MDPSSSSTVNMSEQSCPQNNMEVNAPETVWLKGDPLATMSVNIKVESTCPVCDPTVQDGVLCAEHADKGRQYECLFCETNFSRQASLVWHLKSVHDYNLNTKPKSSPSGTEHNYFERPSCSKCSAQLENAYELEKHLLEHTSSEKKAAASKPKKPVVEVPVVPPVTNCSICKKDFPSEDDYRQHLSQYVTKYRPFFCCICQTTFSRKRSLVFHLYIHKRSSEPDSKVASLSDIADPPRAYPYVPFPNSASVKKTTKLVTKKPLKKAAQSSAKSSSKTVPKTKAVPKNKSGARSKPQIIDIRNNTATNQKCSTCHTKFKKVLDLESHMKKKHHAVTAHKCSLCSQSFVLKASLLNHAISHIF